MRDDDDEGVCAAVRALPPDRSAAIALRHGVDRCVEDIADTMRVTVPAVTSLLHRGRAALRSSASVQSFAEREQTPRDRSA